MRWTGVTYQRPYRPNGGGCDVETCVRTWNETTFRNNRGHSTGKGLMTDPRRALDQARQAVGDAVAADPSDSGEWGVTVMMWTPEACRIDYERMEE